MFGGIQVPPTPWPHCPYLYGWGKFSLEQSYQSKCLLAYRPG